MGKQNYFAILLCIGTETMTNAAATVPHGARDGGTTTASPPSLLGKCTRRKLQTASASDIMKVERGETVGTIGKKLRCFLCLNRPVKANVCS